MTAMDDGRERSSCKYTMQSYSTGAHDNDLSVKIRRNGKLFYIGTSPSRFVNSPRTIDMYLSRLKALNWDEDDSEPGGSELDDDGQNIFDWALRPFEPLFVELAPDLAPGDVVVTLRESLDPDSFVLVLDIVDDELRPRQLHENEDSPFITRHTSEGVSLMEMLEGGNLTEGFPDDETERFVDEGFVDTSSIDSNDLREEFLNDVRRWTRVYDPCRSRAELR